MSSAKSNILDTLSDVGNGFNPDLPNVYKSPVKTNPEKDLIFEEAKTEAGEAKSEKIVPVSTMTSSMESAESSKPAAKLEAPIPDATIIKPISSTSHNEDYGTQEQYLLTDTICTHKEFCDKGHKKSGNYYLPNSSSLSKLGRKLLTNLVFWAILDHCGATYQQCFPSVPMIRCGSVSIDNLSP